MSRLIELIREEYDKNPEFNRREFAAEHGTHHRYVRRIVSQIKTEENGGIPTTLPNRSKPQEKRDGIKTLTVNDLIDRERLDVRKIIRDGVGQIPKGQVAYDETFRRDLGVSAERWRLFAREEEFEPFRAILPTRKTVWGQASTIEDLRQQDGVM